jgi:hypothetical protein
MKIYLQIEFQDVSPSISLSGQATLGSFNGLSFSSNRFIMNLSGGGMTGITEGHLYGLKGSIPQNVAGTFLVNSSALQVLGSFSGCRTATC